ncbi:vascular endothelial growth factor A-like protein, partial [Dinothrombium tinctorium]
TYDEEIERLLIRASNISKAIDFLRTMGVDMTNEPIASRKYKNFADQAVCEPELRTVQLDGSNSGESIMFPKCVRVKRCGGCCVSERMECVPTRKSERDVRRTSIRIKRSAPESSSQTVKVEVHEECRCQCKVKESDCNLSIHTYQNCNCVCKNSEEQVQCFAQANAKYWDPAECKCKCLRTQQCSTGLVFSHATCR